MNSEDLFEAVKGNLKTLDLDDLICREQDRLALWLEPYYSWSERERSQQIAAMYTHNPRAYMYFEPQWPAGQKRVLARQYKEHMARINHLISLRHELLELAYPDYSDDYDNEYSTEIAVRRTEKKELQ